MANSKCHFISEVSNWLKESSITNSSTKIRINMKMVTGLLVLFSMVACSLAENKSDVPPYIECRSNADCKPGYCCTITQQRYTYPTCQQLRAKGEVCRPGKPLLTSGPRYYPNSVPVILNNVHLDLCPCADNLVCSRTDGQCHDA